MSIKIDQALDSIILGGGLKIDLVFENGVYSTWGTSAYTNKKGAYTPAADREFIELKNFPAGSTAFSLNTSDEHVGTYQAIIKYPADSGAIAVKKKSEALLNLFPLGTAIIYSTQKVYPSSRDRDGGRIEGGFYQIVCRINYRAFVAH